MLTKRTLTKWRREALKANKKDLPKMYEGLTAEELLRSNIAIKYIECQERILRLTQILLDQELMKGK